MAKRVFFAFHYQDVIDLRANVVRNHNALQGAQKAGYYDHSIWEASKKVGDLALKRMINSELENSTVTAVLIGTNTWQRRWVRYEIMKSIERGNEVIGIHINGIKGSDGFTKPIGPNPFDYLGLDISTDGTSAKPTEWNGAKWVYYSDVGPFKIPTQSQGRRGKNFNLSTWFSVHDWVKDNGYAHFSTWIQ